MEKNKIFISAGEVSGDIHAAELMKNLSEVGDYEFYGLGGKNMFSEGLKSISSDFSTFNTVGYVESVRFIGRKLRLLRKSVKFMKKNDIKNLIVVDNQGFSIPLARAARKAGIRTFFYVPPRVSIWGTWNASKVAQISDYLIPYLESDLPLYRKYTQNIFYPGNPIIDKISAFSLKDEFYNKNGLDRNRTIVSIFPGSRYQEIDLLLDTLLECAKIFVERYQFQVILPVSHVDYQEVVLKKVRKKGLDGKICVLKPVNDEGVTVSGENAYSAMNVSAVNVMASGTATLESVLFGKPPIICYKISAVTYFMGKKLVKNKQIGLPNILLGKPEFPELLQKECNPETVTEKALEWIEADEDKRAHLADVCKEVKTLIGEPPVVKKVAKYIADIIKNG